MRYCETFVHVHASVTIRRIESVIDDTDRRSPRCTNSIVSTSSIFSTNCEHSETSLRSRTRRMISRNAYKESARVRDMQADKQGESERESQAKKSLFMISNEFPNL